MNAELVSEWERLSRNAHTRRVDSDCAKARSPELFVSVRQLLTITWMELQLSPDRLLLKSPTRTTTLN